jgi:hypothetical protein
MAAFTTLRQCTGSNFESREGLRNEVAATVLPPSFPVNRELHEPSSILLVEAAA